MVSPVADLNACAISSIVLGQVGGIPVVIAVQLLQQSATASWVVEENFEATLRSFFDEVAVFVNSWGPPDDGRISVVKESIFKDFGERGRRGKGGIIVFASGNGGGVKDNVNDDGFASNPYAIAVGSIGDDDRYTDYSEFGSCILLVAPSSGGWRPGIRHDSSEDDFTGTSASAPIVAAVITMLLTAKPSLRRSDVRRILIQSARINDPLDEEWTRNSVGRLFHPFYGFGALDADKALEIVNDWHGDATEEVEICSAWWRGRMRLFQGGEVVVMPPLENALVFVEVASLFVSMTHSGRHQLEMSLTSPSGTESILSRRASEFIVQKRFTDHWYHTNAFDGEFGDVSGWKVTITNHLNDGDLHSLKLCIRGRNMYPGAAYTPTRTNEKYGSVYEYMVSGIVITIGSIIVVILVCKVQTQRPYSSF